MSRYITLYDSNSERKFTTLATDEVSQASEINARRITLITASQPHFVEFGTSTVIATTMSAVISANSIIDLNVVAGSHIATRTISGSSYITIIDAD